MSNNPRYQETKDTTSSTPSMYEMGVQIEKQLKEMSKESLMRINEVLTSYPNMDDGLSDLTPGEALMVGLLLGYIGLGHVEEKDSPQNQKVY